MRWLLCPFVPESNFSLIPSGETVGGELLQMQPSEAQYNQNAVLSIEANPVIPGSYHPELDISVSTLQTELVYANLIWWVGIAVMFLYIGISSLWLHWRLKTAVLLRDNIYQSENVTSPFVFGIMRPRIYLPFCIEEKDMVHVIAHEQTHIRRHDHWIKPFGFLMLSLYWFNPVLWVAYVLLCRDIELACDERVIRELGTDERADYSQALLNCSVSRRTIAVCPLAFGESGVKARVKNVLNYKKPAFRVILTAVVSCIAVAVCFLTNPPEEEPVIPINTIEPTPLEGIEEHIDRSEEVITTAYDEMSDGTWRANGYTYKYRLKVTGRIQNSSRGFGYIVLSNRDDITFEEAWKSTLSSYSDDAFEEGDAIIVGNYLYDYFKMILKVNDALYYGTDETGPMGDSGCIAGKIAASVDSEEVPQENGTSNFGGVGNPYTYDDGEKAIMVWLDDEEWHWFYADEKISN